MNARFAPVVRLSRVLRHIIADSAFSIAMAISVLCMLLAVSAAQDPADPGTPAPSPTTTTIETTPAGARVIVDDIIIGHTPLAETTLPATATRLTLRRRGSIPAVIDLARLRAATAGNPPEWIHRELQPEVHVPHRFDPSRIPAFLEERAQALLLMEEVASNLQLGHVSRPQMQQLCAHAGAALFDGLAGLRASVARRRQVLGADIASQVYGDMVDLDDAPSVDCELHVPGNADGEAILQVRIGEADLQVFAFARDAAQAIDSLAAVYDLARETYDPQSKQLRNDALAVLAVQGMLDSLPDRHTRYHPPSKSISFASDVEGHVSGIGLHLVTDDDGTIIVAGTLSGSPASEGGILPGDAILSVDGRIARPYEPAPIIEALRGPAGTSSRLTLARADEVLEPMVVVRRVLPLRCSASFYFQREAVGYLRLDSFPGEWVIDELRQELEDLAELHMRALIIDLRGNAGGLLDQAAALADLFISEGILVTTSSPLVRVESVHEATAAATTVPADLPVAVLVDGGTASAAEVLAGCLRDHGRAYLIGERTYGKGSVQVLLPLDDGRGTLSVSVGRYYLPRGDGVSGAGLQPDLSVALDRDTRRRLRSRSIYSRTDPRTGDPQLEAAMVYLRTRPRR